MKFKLVNLCIGIFILGIALVLIVGCDTSENYNTKCHYSYSEEDWDVYECESGITLRKIRDER